MKKFILPILAGMTLCVVQQASAAEIQYTYSSTDPLVQSVIDLYAKSHGEGSPEFEKNMQVLIRVVEEQFPPDASLRIETLGGVNIKGAEE